MVRFLLLIGLLGCHTLEEGLEEIEPSPSHPYQQKILAKGRDYREAHDLKTARLVLEQGLSYDQGSGLIHLELAELYLIEGKPMEARAMAQRGLRFADKEVRPKLLAIINDQTD